MSIKYFQFCDSHEIIEYVIQMHVSFGYVAQPNAANQENQSPFFLKSTEDQICDSREKLKNN